MADKFDRYREALVMEEVTLWPAELAPLDPAEKNQLERRLHDTADQAAQLGYLRTHTGFCRQITVTPADLDRVRQPAS